MQKFASSIHVLLVLDFYGGGFHFFLSVLSALRYYHSFFTDFIRIQRISRPHMEVFGKPQLQSFPQCCVAAFWWSLALVVIHLLRKLFNMQEWKCRALFFFSQQVINSFLAETPHQDKSFTPSRQLLLTAWILSIRKLGINLSLWVWQPSADSLVDMKTINYFSLTISWPSDFTLV